MKTIARLLFSVALLALSACSKPAPLPAAQPLRATPQQLEQIPNLQPGPYAVSNSEPQVWTLGDTTLRVRVVQPQADAPPGGFPLVVFSHGNWSDITKYDALLDAWASHGYVIVAPYHLDGGGMMRGIVNALRKGNEGLIAGRVADVKRILDHLDALDALAPGLAARVDRSRIAIAGHSFGAFTAQQLGGAAAVDPKTGVRIDGLDERVRAVIAISPPGPMFDIINDQSWLQMEKPMLVTTGTWDINAHFWPEWQAHKLSYDTAPAGQNWLLVVEGADHYLGNLICRPERKEPPQTDALRMVNAMSITFLNAYLKQDATARAFLDHNNLSDLTDRFARLEHR